MSMSILDKFETVEIKNETRISEEDKVYCETMQDMYQESVTAMQKAIDILKPISDRNDKFRTKYMYRGFIDKHNDTMKLEIRLEDYRKEFINKIANYFSSKYSVTLEKFNLMEKTEMNITYNDILEDIFNQLNGLSFEDKAVQELKKESQERLGRKDNAEVKKNRLTIKDYIFWRESWDGNYKELGFGNASVNALFKSLSHFETGETEEIQCYADIYNQLREGERYYDIFSKYALGNNKAQEMKLYKNGRVDIDFSTNEQAETFMNEYLIG